MIDVKISIIIVNYKVYSELVLCINSIIKSKPNVSYEIIVVDNDEEKTIEKPLLKKFPDVKYLATFRNIGFGAGNNFGAENAIGEYLFFLNPDTRIEDYCLESLVLFLEKNKNVGIVAPILFDENRKLFPIQGSLLLTPLRAIFSLSFLYKYLPQNYLAREYFLHSWDKKSIKEVDVVPGTAFMISKFLFDKIKGFDERFFLFFEENDMCFRVRKLGYKIFMNPKAKVIHLWGSSTKKGKDIHKIFKESRILYFKKYYGEFAAYVVEFFCR